MHAHTHARMHARTHHAHTWTIHTCKHAHTHHTGETEQEEQGYKQNLLFICSITLFSASYIVPIPDFLLLSFFEKFFSLGLHLLLGQPALEGLLIFFGLKHRYSKSMQFPVKGDHSPADESNRNNNIWLHLGVSTRKNRGC